LQCRASFVPFHLRTKRFARAIVRLLINFSSSDQKEGMTAFAEVCPSVSFLFFSWSALFGTYRNVLPNGTMHNSDSEGVIRKRALKMSW
jgi:hypothetical protein